MHSKSYTKAIAQGLKGEMSDKEKQDEIEHLRQGTYPPGAGKFLSLPRFKVSLMHNLTLDIVSGDRMFAILENGK